MNDEARAVKRAYEAEWRAKNKDKVREKNRRYWEKRAAKLKKEAADNGQSGNT